MKDIRVPRVLIVILNYGTYDLTLNLIKELYDKLNYKAFSIMVVDNCSPNESAKVLECEQKRAGYIFYANKANTGYAAGNNIGIRYAIAHDFEYTWILNNDVEITDSDVLNHMIDIVESNLQIGCIGPKIYNLDGIICSPYVNRPTFFNMTFGILLENYKRNQKNNISGEVYRSHGCCMLLRNKAMKEINCLDERTFLYNEEAILAERLISKKYITYYDASVSIIHKESSTMKRISKNKKKFQIIESIKSGEIYLKEYRKYPFIARIICHMTRSIIIFFR